MVNLDTIYFLKKFDLFAKRVEMRFKRSKDQGESNTKIGSWIGVCISFFVIILIGKVCEHKTHDMISYNKIKFSSLTMTNKRGYD